MEIMHLCIYVNNTCDKHCPNCYYSSGQDEMSLDTQMAVSAWVSRNLREEKAKQFKILFLGGEPLQSFDIVKRLYENITEFKPADCGLWEGGWLLFTNGDLLSLEVLSDIKRIKLRVLLNPTTDNFEIIEKKIKTIKAVCGKCSLAIALDELNMSRLPQLTELALKYGCHMRINRLYDGGIIPGYVDEYKKQMKKMFEILLKAEKPYWPNWIMESTYPTFEGPKNPYSCGKWFAVIDPDGSIRGCNADMETKIGHISTHDWKDLKFPQRWSSKNIPECQGCEWANGGLCQGGCPYTKKIAYGDYNKPSPFCSAFKELFPMLKQLKEKYGK